LTKVKRLRRDADQSPPSSAEVKNTWNYTSNRHTWCSIKYKDNLPVGPDPPSWGGRVTANKRGDVVMVPALIGQHLCLVPSAQGSERREGKGPLGKPRRRWNKKIGLLKSEHLGPENFPNRDWSIA
jgi:hypothetical protein